MILGWCYCSNGSVASSYLRNIVHFDLLSCLWGEKKILHQNVRHVKLYLVIPSQWFRPHGYSIKKTVMYSMGIQSKKTWAFTLKICSVLYWGVAHDNSKLIRPRNLTGFMIFWLKMWFYMYWVIKKNGHLNFERTHRCIGTSLVFFSRYEQMQKEDEKR